MSEPYERALADVELEVIALRQRVAAITDKLKEFQNRISDSWAEPECLYLAQQFVDELEALISDGKADV